MNTHKLIRSCVFIILMIVSCSAWAESYLVYAVRPIPAAFQCNDCRYDWPADAGQVWTMGYADMSYNTDAETMAYYSWMNASRDMSYTGTSCDEQSSSMSLGESSSQTFSGTFDYQSADKNSYTIAHHCVNCHPYRNSSSGYSLDRITSDDVGADLEINGR